MRRSLAPLPLAVFLAACSAAGGPAPSTPPEVPAPAAAPAARAEAPGVRRIPVTTSAGTFEVWTRRLGESDEVAVLLLHGGPGATHEYFEIFADHLPPAGVEMYLYDQLGSFFSDQPAAPELWELPRFVDEVEQVRAALGLERDRFVLLGHSWGGMLAIEYALAHPERLRGLVVSNMMSSMPEYDRYAHQVLMPQMDPEVLAEIQALEAAERYDDPRYLELLVPHHYVHHVLRRPPEEWPDAVNRTFEHLNADIYVPLQGPSELGTSGKLEGWDRSGDLASIEVPTLVIGAAHDTMDPAHMAWMAEQLPRGSYLECTEGSHLAMWDATDCYFTGLLAWLEELAALAPSRD